jgi:tripartite-type tricarboxylate transporter receptor subunit TctC
MALHRRAVLAAPAALGAFRASAQTATFPSRPVRIIVPYTPGGVSDITARLIAEPLAAAWGQPVAVENRPGASGIIGAEAVGRAAPDGHVLGVTSSAHAVNPGFFHLPFDTVRDFTYLTMATATPIVLCASAAFPPSTLDELVAYAREAPGKVSYAGSGGLSRLAAVMFGQRAGITMEYIPYRGSSHAHPDLLANRVNIMFETLPAALEHIRSGRLKAFGVCSAIRAAQLPDLAGIGESFMPGFEAATWGVVYGPANLPPAVAARITTDVGNALRLPDVVRRHQGLGADVVPGTSEAATRYVTAEAAKWVEVARQAGIELEGAPR